MISCEKKKLNCIVRETSRDEDLLKFGAHLCGCYDARLIVDGNQMRVNVGDAALCWKRRDGRRKAEDENIPRFL